MLDAQETGSPEITTGGPLAHEDDAAAAAVTAVILRTRIRALAAGQAETTDLLYGQFGVRSTTTARLDRSGDRLAYLAALLADVAWVGGERGAAHDSSRLPAAPEAAEVLRAPGHPAHLRRRRSMSAEQRTAVLAYLDALLAVVRGCADLDEHAPSPTLGREARRFVGDFTEVRVALASL